MTANPPKWLCEGSARSGLTHYELSGDTDFLREEARIVGAGGWQARGTTKHHSSLAHFNPHNSSELSRAPTTLQRRAGSVYCSQLS